MASVKSTCTRNPDPPKEACKEHYLFLLEIYVRSIESRRLAKLNEMFCVPTTVSFQFLDFCPDEELQLTPVDPLFEPQSGIADSVEHFYAGRSVLFALGRDVVTDSCKEFKLRLNVVKKMPQDIRPDVLVGKAVVDLTLPFAALRKEVMESERYPEADLPDPTKCFDDDIALTYDCSPAGTMSIFARISSHGQTIVTEFTSPPSNSSSSFLFRADDKFCEERTLGYRCRVLDPTRCNVSEIISEASSSGSVRRDCMICKPPMMPCSPCRIPSGARIVMTGREERKRSCGEVMGKGEPDSACVKQTCGPIQTSRAPREPCGKAVVLKVSGLLDVCNDSEHQARVTVAPESEAARPTDDPDHDVFILRIGKKGLVGAGEKSDIQLEMRTPKGPDRRPPVRLETREMQTEEEGAGGKKAAKGGKKKKK